MRDLRGEGDKKERRETGNKCKGENRKQRGVKAEEKIKDCQGEI